MALDTLHSTARPAAAPATPTISPEVSRAADRALESAIEGVGIPSGPRILADLRLECAKDEPDLRRVGALVASDVGLAAGVIRAANSPIYALRSPVASVQQAFQVLGLVRITQIMTGLLLRQALGGGVRMERFWDASMKLAAMNQVVGRRAPSMLDGTGLNELYTYGLFQEAGIAVLIQRFPDYKDTLKLANGSFEQPFPEVERDRHKVDHTVVGQLLARAWGLPPHMAMAIRHHHDYTQLAEGTLAPEAVYLVSVTLVANRLIEEATRLAPSLEWEKGGSAALARLEIDEAAFADLQDEAQTLLGKL